MFNNAKALNFIQFAIKMITNDVLTNAWVVISFTLINEQRDTGKNSIFFLLIIRR